MDAKAFGDIREGREERERENGEGLGKSKLRTMRATCGCLEVHVRCKSCRLISRKTHESGGKETQSEYSRREIRPGIIAW